MTTKTSKKRHQFKPLPELPPEPEQPSAALRQMPMGAVIEFAKQLKLPIIDFTLHVSFYEATPENPTANFHVDIGYDGVLALLKESRDAIGNTVIDVSKNFGSWGLNDRFVPMLNLAAEAAEKGIVDGTVPGLHGATPVDRELSGD